MKFDYFKNKQELLSTGLFWVSAAVFVLIVVRVGTIFVSSAEAARLVGEAAAQSEVDPNDTEKYFAKSKELAEELKKKNMFAPPPPKKHPVKAVLGILGNEAFINGKWYKVGGKIGDAEIVKIAATYVKIKWDGKEKAFSPIGTANPDKAKKKVKKAKTKKQESKETVTNKEEAVEDEVAEVSEDDPLAWMGVKMSAALRAKLLEKWNEMSDEEKQQWKDRWNSMTDEQKEAIIEQLEQNIDQI